MINLTYFRKEQNGDLYAWGKFELYGREIEVEVRGNRIILICSVNDLYPDVDEDEKYIFMNRKSSIAGPFVVKEQLEGAIQGMLIEFSVIIRDLLKSRIQNLSDCMKAANDLLSAVEGASND